VEVPHQVLADGVLPERFTLRPPPDQWLQLRSPSSPSQPGTGSSSSSRTARLGEASSSVGVYDLHRGRRLARGGRLPGPSSSSSHSSCCGLKRTSQWEVLLKQLSHICQLHTTPQALAASMGAWCGSWL